LHKIGATALGTSGNQLALLQMLMPIVRPDGIAPTGKTHKLPLEDQTFEQMLSGMQQSQDMVSDTDSMVDGDESSDQSAPLQMMQQLGGMNRIENTTLRDMLAQSRTETADQTQQ
jgi:hypothetical protein